MPEYNKRTARHDSSAKVPRPGSLLRLQAVLDYLPISRTTFLEGIRKGKYPAPVKLGPRLTVWRADDIIALVEQRP